MSTGSDTTRNDVFLKANEKNGEHLEVTKNPSTDKRSGDSLGDHSAKHERSNTNNEVLNFNDNYTAILQNLASDNSHLFTNAFSPNDVNTPGIINFKGNTDADSNRNLEHVSSNEKQNLDALLQHYQTLLSKSVNPNNSTFQLNPNPDSQASTPTGYHGNNTNGNGESQNVGKNGNNKSIITESPCDHCRRRRTKCVIVPNLTNCIQCETKGIKCTFSELPHKGYNPPGTGNKHARSSESTNSEVPSKRGKLQTNNVDNENVAQYYTELLQHLNDSMSNSMQGNQSQGSPYNKVSSNPNMGNSSQLNQQQDHQQQRQQFSQQQSHTQFPRSSFYVGATSIYDINLVNHIKLDHIDQIQLSPSVALRRVAPNVQFILRDNFNQELYMKQEQEIDMVEKLVFPHGKILVDIFFKLIHPHFPILHERVFLEKYARSYRELTAPLLASVYSLSLHWWDFHPKLISFTKPDVSGQLNEIAFRTFFDMIERPKLSMVQTGLLLLQCRSECSNNWVLNSAVVALAEELGLGVDCQDWRLPRWERGLRRRLAWAVWCQDKWTSLLESRPSHLLFGRNWMVRMLSEEDFPNTSPVISESNDSSKQKFGMGSSLSSGPLFDMFPANEDFVDGTLMFQQVVSLSVILGEIMDTFYTEGAIQVTSKIEQVLKLAKPLQLKLREWYHSLPSKLSMNKFVPRKFNANATLTLAYFAAEITLHRKIITTLKQDTPVELVQVCRTAAKTRLVAAIEFVRDLKNEHINAFWYTFSTGNLMLIGTFAALLYVTSKTRDEASTFRDCLRNYIWILKVGAKSFDRSANALNRIHILLNQIPGLLTDEQPKEFMPTRSQSPIYQSQQWKSSSSVDFQQSSPNLNQLRNLPAELLQTLSNMQTHSPYAMANKNSNSTSSPGFNNGQRSDANTQYSGNNSIENPQKTMESSSPSVENLSPANMHSVSKPISNSESKLVSNRMENTHNSHISSVITDKISQVQAQERVTPSAASNIRGKPITPQSVNGANPTKGSPSLTTNDSNNDSVSNQGSTISPDSVQDKQETNGDNEPHRGESLDILGPNSMSSTKLKDSENASQESLNSAGSSE